MRKLRIVAGIFAWVLLVGSGWWWAQTRLLAEATPTSLALEDVWLWSTQPQPRVDLVFDRPVWLQAGDPIYVPLGDGTWRQVGELAAVLEAGDAGSSSTPPGELQLKRSGRTRRARAVFHAGAPPVHAESTLSYHRADASMQWVLATMLPAEKRAQIAGELSQAYQTHHPEIIAALRPLVRQSMQDAFGVVEQDLEQALLSRRGKLAEIGARYQEELVQGEIVPLVRREVWPIVRKHAEPAAVQIGQQMWQEVSLWRFSLAFVKDRALGREGQIRQEWELFLKEKGVPILERHTDDFVKITRDVLSETSRNPAVRRSVRKNVRRVLEDEELRKLVWSIIREVVIDNPRLREVFERTWTSPEARAAFQLAGDRMEPTVQRIGELLFGERDGEITPEFARVLRRQVLLKDRRWLILDTGQSGDSNRASSASTSASRTNATRLTLHVRYGGAVPDPPVVVHGRRSMSRSAARSSAGRD